MRVITGTAKGKNLSSPVGLETRPTSDMVKEAIFSIIQFEVQEAFILDLFAGSGQLGIEALSRGAKFGVFVDTFKEAQTIIRQNLQAVDLASQSRVVAMDYMSFLNSTVDKFDIAFLDPPYAANLLDKALPVLAQKMNDTGVIICETDKTEKLPQEIGDFKLYRDYKYGKKKITVYRKEREEI